MGLQNNNHHWGAPSCSTVFKILKMLQFLPKLFLYLFHPPLNTTWHGSSSNLTLCRGNITGFWMKVDEPCLSREVMIWVRYHDGFNPPFSTVFTQQIFPGRLSAFHPRRWLKARRCAIFRQNHRCFRVS